MKTLLVIIILLMIGFFIYYHDRNEHSEIERQYEKVKDRERAEYEKAMDSQQRRYR